MERGSWFCDFSQYPNSCVNKKAPKGVVEYKTRKDCESKCETYIPDLNSIISGYMQGQMSPQDATTDVSKVNEILAEYQKKIRLLDQPSPHKVKSKLRQRRKDVSSSAASKIIKYLKGKYMAEDPLLFAKVLYSVIELFLAEPFYVLVLKELRRQLQPSQYADLWSKEDIAQKPHNKEYGQYLGRIYELLDKLGVSAKNYPLQNEDLHVVGDFQLHRILLQRSEKGASLLGRREECLKIWLILLMVLGEVSIASPGRKDYSHMSTKSAM